MADSQRTIGRNDQPEPGGSESPPRPEKAELERQKLELEKQLLQRQLSAAGATMEWLKAAAVPVAVLGAAISFFIGFGQINQAEQNRSVDRFDKALTRLASDKVNERITGVSGLRLFLAESGSLLQGSALHFLVNAVAVESDEFVQSAMLDIFVDMKSLKLDQAKLNEALRTAIEHNRSLTKKIRTGRKERIAAIQKKIVAGSKQFEGLQANIPTPIPKRLVARLSQNEYLDFLDAQLGTFEKLDVKDDVPLHGLARLITMLLKLGAAGKDFSEIYCENCNFDAANLSGATFNDSYLRKANFSHTVLNGASFRNADLGGTIFFAADLSQADMRKTRFSSPDFSDTRESFPLLECADLRGTDLSGITLLGFERPFSTTYTRERPFDVVAPAMLLAQTDQTTKLDSFSIISYTDVSDAYLLKYSRGTVLAALHHNSGDLADDPLLTGVDNRMEYHRSHGTFATNEAYWTSTMYIQHSEITADDLRRIKSDVKPALKGYLNQLPLMAVPLLKEFNAALGEAVQRLPGAAKKSYTCSDVKSPSPEALILDSRDRD